VSISIGDCPIVSEAERKALIKAKKRSLKEGAKKKSSTSITLDEYRHEVEAEEEKKRRLAEIAAQDPNEAEPEAGPSKVSKESSDDSYVLVDVDPFTVFDVKMTNE
jgi:Tfp pilus assembly protein PilO